MIEVKDVTFRYPYGVEALRGISLEIKEGEFVVIMGENGAGKTTLIKHFNGLLKPREGDVLVDGGNTKRTTVASLAREVGLVFQNPDHQFFCESVEEEIRFALKNFEFSDRDIEDRVNWALKFFGLQPYKRRSPFLLSGGEKKRLAIASVLAWDPKYIVLDEPTIGQDYRQKQRLLRLLFRLKGEGKTVIIATHDVEFAADCGHRVVLMRGGEIVADDDAEVLLTDVDKLREASILSPQVTQISLALSDMGFPKTFDIAVARGSILRYLREGRWPS